VGFIVLSLQLVLEFKRPEPAFLSLQTICNMEFFATKTPILQNPPKTNIYCFLLWWTLVFLWFGGIFDSHTFRIAFIIIIYELAESFLKTTGINMFLEMIYF